MSTTEQLLEAGALLTVKQKTKSKEPVDAVSARIYSHPALASPVVRLTADNLAQGDDLAMEFLGFAEPTVEGPVAKRRRQALGFPGWALIHDPKHARYALELVKSMKKAARRAKSKPGHAYDEFLATSKKLGRSVAHFLPSYWEEVGRTYIEVGGDTFASRAFNKAREAEKVHALKVDESVRRDAFLEFALAGCLSIKTLTEYGKELQDSLKPEQAWEFYRELCVRRTLGGMPPYGTIRRDLDRILKTTKLDRDAEQLSFLQEILESPSMVRAADGFWQSYENELRILAEQSPRAAGILLNLIPDWGYWTESVWTWTAFLDKIGILSNAWEKDAPEEARPTGSPAAWYHTRLRTVPPEAFALLDRMADRLRADGVPVDLMGEAYTIDVDLLDTALECKIPVADPDKDARFELSTWAEVEGIEGRPRDPKQIHKDKRFKKLLAAAVPDSAGEATFEEQARGKVALKEARRNWLTQLVAGIDKAALPHAGSSISETQQKTYQSTFREFPEPYTQLKAIDLAPVLAKNLRGGLLDEYGWPALEQAIDKLTPADQPAKKKTRRRRYYDDDEGVNVYGSLPHLIVSDGVTAIVVDRDKIVMEQELPIPKKHSLTGIAWIDGRLALQIRNETNYQSATFWADQPKKRSTDHRLSSNCFGATVTLPSGQSFSGDKAISANDTYPQQTLGRFLFDGNTVWETDYDWTTQSHTCREKNPIDGSKGRHSLPAFFEDFIATGDTFEFNQSSLLNLGDWVNNSPMGSKNGSVGWRCKTNAKKKTTADGIDGRSWKQQGDQSITPVAMLDLPGTDQHILVDGDYQNSGYSDTELWNASGDYVLDNGKLTGHGQAAQLPVLHWHFLQARDVATSKRLRKVTDKDAAKLMKAAQEDLKLPKEKGKPRTFPSTRKALTKLIPKLKHERLITGLVNVIREAAEQQNQIAKIIAKKDPDAPDPIVIPNRVEELVNPAFRQFGLYWSEYRGKFFNHVQYLGQYFQGTLPATGVPQASEDWTNFLLSFPERLLVAIHREREDGKEPEWLEFLEQWAKLPMHELTKNMRFISGEFPDNVELPYSLDEDEDDEGNSCPTFEQKGSRYSVYPSWRDVEMVEYAANGKFHTPNKFKLKRETSLSIGWTSENLVLLVAAARNNGIPKLDREQIESIVEQLDISFAEAALLWYPEISKDIRKELKLKAKEVNGAAESLGHLPTEFRDQLRDALFEPGPTALWTDTSAVVEKIVETWKANAPRRLALSTAMVSRVPAGSEHLAAMAQPKKHPIFSNKSKYKLTDDIECKPTESHFSSSDVETIVTTLLILNGELPVGDEARSDMPAVHTAIVAALKNPNLLFDCGYFYEWSEQDQRKKLPAIFNKIKKTKEADHADDGVLLAVANTGSIRFAFRPARTVKQSDRDRVCNAVVSTGANLNNSIGVVELLRSDELKSIIDRIKKTPVPAGQYEANPFHSVPDLVATVAKKLKVSTEAAGLYLQVLALPEPTTNNIKLWNDWKPATLKAAVTELVKAKHLLTAKRARAGRDFFVPGGWEPLKAPHIPMETWKLATFGITRNEHGAIQMPLERILCLKPFHEQFAAAWKRITSGDIPAYEDVK